MKANVGGADKILRIVVGLGLLSLILILEGNARWWGLVGLVPLLTGVFNFCPLYTLLGLNTCPMKNKSA
ncbi:MAG: YgaP family membrane protein [Burkholderiales bacterium]